MSQGSAERTAAQRDRPTAPDGFVIVDKPQGWTSHDVVGRVRRLAATRKVGHAGTLDPMATGVLVLGIGRATKLLTYVVGEDKEYRATIRLGQSTTTDDAEGEPVSSPGAGGVDRDALGDHVAALTGEIQQVPSAVSAIKVDGQRAYARVRAGETVELAARSVTVSRFDVDGLHERTTDDGTPVLDLDVTVVCSSGTYIRALARDLGAALRCGGHLTMLRRSRVGGYGLDTALTLEQMAEQVESDGRLAVMPLVDAARARFDVRELSATEVVDLGYGKRLASDGRHEGAVTAAVSPEGELIALVRETGRDARPVLVFAPA